MGRKHATVDESENITEIDNALINAVQSYQVIENHLSSNPVVFTNLDEKNEENRPNKKIKAKEKIYTLKTIIDKHVGTDWASSRIMPNLIPSQDCIESHISIILSSCNPNAITLRKLYALLSICYNINLLNIDIHNLYQIIKENLLKLRKSDKEIKKIKKARDKKRYK